MTDQIMLRFRPIAPKPAGSGEAYATAVECKKRVKRKYVRVRERRRGKRKFKQPSPPEKSGDEHAPLPEEAVVTLLLLGDGSQNDKSDHNIIPENLGNWKVDRCKNKPTEECSFRSGIETWMIVECVTERFAGVGLGFSDEEKIYQLEIDTCPGFVSDRNGNVIWLNWACKKMVTEEEAAPEEGFPVWLVVKEELPRFCPSFACRMRVTRERREGQKWNKIVPCDVWRMEFGGFAWKLDVNTALSLGY